MVKVLHGCVACVYCTHKIDPHAVGVLTANDMAMLNYSGCKILDDNRLVNASRKCGDYMEVRHEAIGMSNSHIYP